ncbi:tetratricopeptide repeat protein [Arenimonas malthae]|nr:hypothetical protein [Arenimonas malthae]
MTEARRPPWRWLVLVALLFAGWRVATLGLADHYARSSPERALFWRADHPEALLARAEALGRVGPEGPPTKADAEMAAEYARRALRADPLDGRPYRVLGQLAAAEGNEARAAGLFTLAARRAPRDRPAHFWLLDHHLKASRPAQAMPHLDTLLRIQPNLFTRFEPLLLALAGAPPAHAALADTLAKNPPWRARFLVLASSKGEDAAAMAPLFEQLRQTPGGLADNELGPWLDRLVREGRVGQAYLLWAGQLPKEKLAALGNVYNGGFEHEPAPVGFDWRFARVPGARIERLSTEGAGGRVALRVAFEDRRVPFAHVRQMLALPAGRYRFQAQAKADSLRTDRGLVWQLACVAGGKPLGETPPLLGHTPWRTLELAFEVPPGCEGQWLTLRLPARIPAEQRIGGRAWFDDLKISRLP